MYFQDLHQRDVLLQSVQTCLACVLVYGKSKYIFVLFWKGVAVGRDVVQEIKTLAFHSKLNSSSPNWFHEVSRSWNFCVDSGWHVDKRKESAQLRASSRSHRRTPWAGRSPWAMVKGPFPSLRYYWSLYMHWLRHFSQLQGGAQTGKTTQTKIGSESSLPNILQLRNGRTQLNTEYKETPFQSFITESVVCIDELRAYYNLLSWTRHLISEIISS